MLFHLRGTRPSASDRYIRTTFTWPLNAFRLRGTRLSTSNRYHHYLHLVFKRFPVVSACIDSSTRLSYALWSIRIRSSPQQYVGSGCEYETGSDLFDIKIFNTQTGPVLCWQCLLCVDYWLGPGTDCSGGLNPEPDPYLLTIGSRSASGRPKNIRATLLCWYGSVYNVWTTDLDVEPVPVAEPDPYLWILDPDPQHCFVDIVYIVWTTDSDLEPVPVAY